MTWEVRQGDCREVMAGMDADSVDAIVCDPPYGLSFMGKGWDHGVPGEEFWADAAAVVKPGSHLLAFGGTRTFHRLTCAIEDAGWEIRDCLSWLYGQGFPKSHNLPGGLGTALKPAWEPIIVARWPFAGTVAEAVAAHHVGALRIDDCRIGTEQTKTIRNGDSGGRAFGRDERTFERVNPPGRWPANVALDEAAAQLLDESVGVQVDGVAVRRNGGGGDFFGGINPKFKPDAEPWADAGFGGSGGPSRYFYTAKASRGEREAGLREAGGRPAGGRASGRSLVDGGWVETGSEPRRARNVHPTVKPVALMRWLVRLVTPPGGLVLDPFTGSGTTGIAAVLEGCRFLGIEREAEYVEIARARIAHHAQQTGLFAAAV